MADRDSGRAARPEFSVIITCYFEEGSIDEFHARLSATLRSMDRTFEIVMVNDGSTDGTFDKLRGIFARDPQVSTIIDLFRNYGQTVAMSCGIAHARGRHFIFMDSDLQLDPEELPLLLAEFDRGNDVVSGFRQGRKDPWFRTLPSRFANFVMRRVSGHKMRDFGCTFKVYRGELVRAFGFGPRKAWKTAYVVSHAQRVREIAVTHHPRKYGKSGWSFAKLSGFLMDHVVGMTSRLFQFLLVVCLFLGLVVGVRIALAYLAPLSILPSVTPGLIINSLLLHLLVLLAVLSAIGEYVIRSFQLMSGDPIYVVREIQRKEEVMEDRG